MIRTMLNTVCRMPKNDQDIQAATDAVNAQAAVVNQLCNEHVELVKARAVKAEQCYRAQDHLATLMQRRDRLRRGEA